MLLTSTIRIWVKSEAIAGRLNVTESYQVLPFLKHLPEP